MDPKTNFERIWKDHDARYWEFRSSTYKKSIERTKAMEDERWVMSMLRSYMEK